MVLFLRSLAMQVAFYGWTIVMLMASATVLPLHRRYTLAAQRIWSDGLIWLLRVVAGIHLRQDGRENLPAGPCIIACKHQSAWDTMVWHTLVDDPAIVMKKELLAIPVYGWMARKSRMIPVDRAAGAAAMRTLLRAAGQAKADGRTIVIFPQGTRVDPGVSMPYQPGVAAVYRALDLPVVPVALNSGMFWPRRGFWRPPGTIRLQYLPPIPPSLDRATFMARLEAAIEPATTRLEAEARNSTGIQKG